MNIGSDLSFFSLIFGASLPVQLVMLILIAASVISWKFIYLKVKFLKESEENAQEFEKFFWSGGDLAKLYESVSNNSRAINGLAEIFRSGYKEYMGQKEHQAFDKKSIESVRRAMRASYNREIDTLDQHLPFLASVGSPFSEAGASSLTYSTSIIASSLISFSLNFLCCKNYSLAVILTGS